MIFPCVTVVSAGRLEGSGRGCGGAACFRRDLLTEADSVWSVEAATGTSTVSAVEPTCNSDLTAAISCALTSTFWEANPNPGLVIRSS